MPNPSTRHLPLPAYDEHQDQRDDERVNRDRFGEGHTQDHVRLDVRRRIGIASHRLQRALHQNTDADARANRAQTDRQTRAQQSQRINIEPFPCLPSSSRGHENLSFDCSPSAPECCANVEIQI